MLSQAPPISSTDGDFLRLKQHVIETTGLAYYMDRDQDLIGHIQHRIRALGLHGQAGYLDLLRSGLAGDDELDRLAERLTIGETYFFRHPEAFDALRDRVLPGIIENNRSSRRLRVWSAGCSIGAEAYSLSILLQRDLAHLLAGWDISILGTDINRRFLAEAREGRFSEWALRGMSEALRLACFAPDGKLWRVRPEYQGGVLFQYHNLAQHPFPSLVNNLFAFDLILCRNVLMYFNAEVAGRIIRRFHASLVPGGCLIVGHSENNAAQFRDFELLQMPGATLYRRPAPGSAVAAAPADAASGAPPQPYLPWIAPPPIKLPGSPAGSASPGPAHRAPAPPPRIPSREALREEARQLADAGQLQLAIRRCRTMIETDPLDVYAYLLYGLLLEQVGQTGEALQALQRCLYLDRHCALGHYYLGLLHQGHGHASAAMRSFRNALDALARQDPVAVVSGGDGLTVGELSQLARTQMEVLSAA